MSWIQRIAKWISRYSVHGPAKKNVGIFHHRDQAASYQLVVDLGDWQPQVDMYTIQTELGEFRQLLSRFYKRL